MQDNKEYYINELTKRFESLILTKNELSGVLKVSEATVDRLRKNGSIKNIKIGNQVMFPVTEVAEYLAKGS